MAFTAGKNKVEKGFRIQVDDSGGAARDLSGDLVIGSLSGGGIIFDEVDMAGVSESVINFLSGHGNSTIAGNFHVNDTATTGAFTVINGNNGGTGTVTLQWGSLGTAPSTGDIEWAGEYVYFMGELTFDAGKTVFPVTLKPTGAVAPSFGTVT